MLVETKGCPSRTKPPRVRSGVRELPAPVLELPGWVREFPGTARKFPDLVREFPGPVLNTKRSGNWLKFMRAGAVFRTP